MNLAGRIIFLLDPTYATMGVTALAAAGISASVLLLRSGLSAIPLPLRSPLRAPAEADPGSATL
jgi:hypothetical protein